MENIELTYGQRLVGVDFNPSANTDVQMVKELYANLIDRLNEKRHFIGDSQKGKLLSIAIEKAVTAQMWAVKGITYNEGRPILV